MTYECFQPGQEWLDTNGNLIQAHGGSIIVVDGTYYWYGENKEKNIPGGKIVHWGVRAYRSNDLYNWEDCGLIIPPDVDDLTSPLHPHVYLDRPHIIYNAENEEFVCWIKVISPKGQRSTVLTSKNILGPYTIVTKDLKPLGMNAGDFDLVVDPTDGKAYYYFERVHSELVCADLTSDYRNVTGYYSTHFPLKQPPYVREGVAYFERSGVHYLITSGTTGYYPNPSLIATADSYHGPWRFIGDVHPSDVSRTSFHSQVSCVFKHPEKEDLYIAMADRWLPHYTESSADAIRMHEERFRPMGGHQDGNWKELTTIDTARARYVWLPLTFDGDNITIEWHDEWKIEDFD
ncbi:family 43 glycosylhydrolase [Schaalia sp. ZJ1691]|uniref:family 43 glycosylhydrolase n=1 Tax=Schaalia sp. ZJ1691 TaxID=2709404 RepID=UPI0013EE122D|nr:family 43 glycosylhydrolase [Schaalia sp. ZJ1691]